MMPPVAFVFDAYGTLFDVHSVAALAEQLAPGNGAALSRLWRTKQLEYTWLQSLMATSRFPREDFAALTAHALDYAISALILPLDGEARLQLLDAYQRLAPFPGTRDVLAALAPRPRWILSNGTRAMLEPLARSTGLEDVLDGIISVDEVDIYKPSPRVYQLAVDRLGVPPATIGFVSSNGWDAAGANAFGFTTFWINRDGVPTERHAPGPDFVLGSLRELLPLVTS
ncbi:MAG: haloacid dehalogenase type II [Betaproteobacteria bacterium]|nr:MAG: haloacid dehalogenase type II [Betaproteobacteria bacterium]